MLYRINLNSIYYIIQLRITSTDVGRTYSAPSCSFALFNTTSQRVFLLSSLISLLIFMFISDTIQTGVCNKVQIDEKQEQPDQKPVIAPVLDISSIFC